MGNIEQHRKDFIARRIHNIAKRAIDNNYSIKETNNLVYIQFNTMFGKESVPVRKHEHEYVAQLLQ